MYKNRLLTLVLLGGSTIAIHATDLPKTVAALNQFQEFRLAQGEIYELYVKFGDGVTTVTFPSAISKIAGVNVSADGSGDFLIAAKPGSCYFNLVALKKGATGTLTVIHNRRTYILYLRQDDEKAFAAVNFAAGSGGTHSFSSGSANVTPARLLSLIDLAKGYQELKQRYPAELRDTIHAENHRIFDYGRFKIELREVVRFNREDTLVFKLLMHNNSQDEIAYDKFSFSAQLGGKNYYMSASDAGGVMPPQSSTWAFFTITGTPDGGRNNLAPDNEFMIGVTAEYMEEKFRRPDILPEVRSESTDPTARRLNELAERLEAKLSELEELKPLPAEEKTAHEILPADKISEAPVELRNNQRMPSGDQDGEQSEAEKAEISFWKFSEFPRSLLPFFNQLIFWQ